MKSSSEREKNRVSERASVGTIAIIALAPFAIMISVLVCFKWKTLHANVKR